jgi:predicted metal-dependent hydrolase
MAKRQASRRSASKRELLGIGGRPVEVTMRLNPRARRLIVKVHPSTGEVTVIAPSQRALERAMEFARGQSGWIAGQIARVPARIPFDLGAKIPFRGREHLVVPGEQGKGPVTVTGETIAVTGRGEHVPRRLLDYLKREARRTLEARTLEYAAKIDAKVRRVSVRDTASRWGSCSANKTISYCWRLILAPDFVRDYVVAHEVAHLRELNHGPKFWELVRALAPDIETPQRWLRKNGTLLHRYGA